MRQALLAFGEHRYYGQTMPFGKDSFTGSNAGYLSVTQALSDYASLLEHVKERWNMAPDAPVVSFGGSYGGMLSGWFRYKYPGSVIGTYAAEREREYSGSVIGT